MKKKEKNKLMLYSVAVVLICIAIPVAYSWSLKNKNSLKLDFTVKKTIPHDKQGFEYYNGFIYETTGLYGKSIVKKMNPDTGEVIKSVKLEDKYFGEGCTIFNGKLYVLTWKEKTGFIFNPDTLEKESEFTFTSTRNEGWGLTHDDQYLIMSDGSNYLHYYDKDFKFIKKIAVNYQQQPINQLNELENINGLIWANIWYKNFIIVIDPSSGEVVHTVDCKDLVKQKGYEGDVLNGILYYSNHVYLSGKLWNKIFVVDFEKLPQK